MAETVYILSALTSLLCSVLLIRGYRRSRVRLLMWSSMCFLGMAISNVALIVDLVIVPDTDLRLWRNLPVLIGLVFLLFGLIWDAE